MKNKDINTSAHPKREAALFRWILDQRKLEEKQSVELTESQSRTVSLLKKENAERGIAVVGVQLPV